MTTTIDQTLIEDTLKKLLAELQLNFNGISIAKEGDNILRVTIDCPEPRQLIGWHGETLNSLQHLLKSILRAKQHADSAVFVVLDVDGYRKEQEDRVRSIAEQKAEFVRRTGHRIALPPMSPYFRRIVHLHVASLPTLADLTTESIGEGEFRQILLKMKQEKSAPSQSSEELTPVIMAKDDGLENLDI